MSSLTKSARGLLEIPRREGIIKKLELKLYLISDYSSVIGPLIWEHPCQDGEERRTFGERIYPSWMVPD
ncbi:hypothetical protein E2562_006876 [Oryza meyeriana var. granulata]|uniref:Uncharacterized protein n=1 Tax=Oryza meyeriana var. granulata TaxID=110450 RepID=A0A6G1C3D6_9ORYZ|nr:hypothetical protein E2562_006876 [Oryza meyeriana var. granulata]